MQRLIWSILEFLKNKGIPRVRGPDGFFPSVSCSSLLKSSPRKPKKLLYSTISMLATTFKIKSQLFHCKRKFCLKVKWNKHVYYKRLYYLDLPKSNTASHRKFREFPPTELAFPCSPSLTSSHSPELSEHATHDYRAALESQPTPPRNLTNDSSF